MADFHRMPPPPPPLDGTNLTISVGFSDTILLAVSVIGFGVLTVTIYSILIAKLSTTPNSSSNQQQQQQQRQERQEDEEGWLLLANVATLTRAQCRARAKIIMKQQRRKRTGVLLAEDDAAQNDGPEQQHQQQHPNMLHRLLRLGNNNEEPDNDNENNEHDALPPEKVGTRQQRQRAAKEAEKVERRRMAAKRHQAHDDLGTQTSNSAASNNDALLKQQKQSHISKSIMEREAEILRDRAAWSTFLTRTATNDDPVTAPSTTTSTSSTPIRTKMTTMITVEDFRRDCQTNRIQDVDQLAVDYQVSSTVVVDRIQQLIQECRLTGFFLPKQNGYCSNNSSSSSSNLFVFVSDDELDAIATRIIRGKEDANGVPTVFGLDAVAAICQGVIFDADVTPPGKLSVALER